MTHIVHILRRTLLTAHLRVYLRKLANSLALPEAEPFRDVVDVASTCWPVLDSS